MITGRMLTAMAVLALLQAGCRSAEIPPAGAYVESIWTEPERVTTGMLVALHMREAGDYPPEIFPLELDFPQKWEVSAGLLYEWPMEYVELPPWEVLAAQPACQELFAYSSRPVLWLTPESPQLVLITAKYHGDPLTVSITVHATD